MTTRTERAETVKGVLAEFDTPDELVHAAEAVREHGFADVEAFSPFPIHSLDKALGIKASPLPWLVLAAGIVGGVLALLGQWWTGAVDYPLIISGKPLFSVPASIPVAFEVVILFGAFAAFFGMLSLNRLPRLWNPLTARLRRISRDRFALFIVLHEANGTRQEAIDLLLDAGANVIEDYREEAAPAKTPTPIFATLTIIAALALIPPVLIARARVSRSEKPPLSWFPDMDYQPKRKAQSVASMFADGRAMRPPVPGAVPRGENFDETVTRGVEEPANEPTTRVADSTDTATGSPVSVAADDNDPGAPALEPRWTKSIPIPVSEKLIERGRTRYNTFCATCHGRAGDGDGPVSKRALALEQGTWVQPTSLHAKHVREQPAGRLFHSITHGVRKMPGYGDATTPEDRWAIILYVRALQKTRLGAPDDLPPEALNRLRELN